MQTLRVVFGIGRYVCPLLAAPAARPMGGRGRPRSCS